MKIPLRNHLGLFEETVGQSGFPMVDMGDYTKISYFILRCTHWGLLYMIVMKSSISYPAGIKSKEIVHGIGYAQLKATLHKTGFTGFDDNKNDKILIFFIVHPFVQRE